MHSTGKVHIQIRFCLRKAGWKPRVLVPDALVFYSCLPVHKEVSFYFFKYVFHESS